MRAAQSLQVLSMQQERSGNQGNVEGKIANVGKGNEKKPMSNSFKLFACANE